MSMNPKRNIEAAGLFEAKHPAVDVHAKGKPIRLIGGCEGADLSQKKMHVLPGTSPLFMPVDPLLKYKKM